MQFKNFNFQFAIYNSLFFSVVLGLALNTHAATFRVGPAQPLTSIGAVPWDSLHAGDTVFIHYRATPYAEKWVLCRQGTPAAPIVVRGVPDQFGTRPVIEGINATTRTQLNYWNETRGLIKIGGANTPADVMPQYITIENLDIKSARQPYRFTGRAGDTPYDKNAAAVFIEKGQHIIIRNCILRDCGNGLFCASLTTDLLVEGCYIYDNGADSSIYEHNNYTEATGIVFQFNHFGPLRTGCLGNNLKDRSAGLVVRYNWIESGNRQLDLVDSDYPELYNLPAYRATYVYGNVLVEPDGAGNSQICHYGGDSGDTTRYRKGTLYFYHNTVVSTRTGNTTLFRLSSAAESIDARNNIYYGTAAGSRQAVLDNEGTVNLYANWLKTGWVKSHSNSSANVTAISGNITGTEPGFYNFTNQGLELSGVSACREAGTSLAPAVLPAYDCVYEYVKHQGARARHLDGTRDPGAFEYYNLGVPRAPRPSAPENLFSVYTDAGKIVITSRINSSTAVSASICDADGRFVAGLRRESATNGKSVWAWDPSPHAAGVYGAVLEDGAGQWIKKFVVIR
jgi:hypothetical protein